jgi:hypothetical protein
VIPIHSLPTSTTMYYSTTTTTIVVVRLWRMAYLVRNENESISMMIIMS